MRNLHLFQSRPCSDFAGVLREISLLLTTVPCSYPFWTAPARSYTYSHLLGTSHTQLLLNFFVQLHACSIVLCSFALPPIVIHTGNANICLLRRLMKEAKLFPGTSSRSIIDAASLTACDGECIEPSMSITADMNPDQVKSSRQTALLYFLDDMQCSRREIGPVATTMEPVNTAPLQQVSNTDRLFDTLHILVFKNGFQQADIAIHSVYSMA